MTESLRNAMRAFIAHGGDRSIISVPHWATTYNCGHEDVRSIWEQEATKASLSLRNQYEEFGGK